MIGHRSSLKHCCLSQNTNKYCPWIYESKHKDLFSFSVKTACLKSVWTWCIIPIQPFHQSYNKDKYFHMFSHVQKSHYCSMLCVSLHANLYVNGFNFFFLFSWPYKIVILQSTPFQGLFLHTYSYKTCSPFRCRASSLS